MSEEHPAPEPSPGSSASYPVPGAPLVPPGAAPAADGPSVYPAYPTPGQQPGGPGGPYAGPYAPAYPMGAGGGRPLHKPGTIPLRPLTLSDFFDGAFTTVRRNPRATIGMGALVTAGFMLIPILGAIVIALLGGLDGAMSLDGDGSGAGAIGLNVAQGVTGVFSLLANIVVTGLIVPVVTRAAIGEKVTISASWRQVRGRLLALLGLSLLELLVAVVVIGVPTALGALLGYAVGGVVGAVLVGLLLLLLGFLATLAIHVKWFQLAAPGLVVERRGVFASIARAGRLSGGSFWRITGILVLTSVLTALVGQIIGLPFGILGAILGVSLPEPFGPVALLVSANLASVVSGAIVAPFTATVAVLQYLDQRFRREGFDIELITHVQGRQAP